MPTFAIDTETFYSNDCNVGELGPYAYARHPDWKCYLVSVAGDDGTRFVGAPEGFDWSIVDGQTWVMHNATFDLEMIDRMVEIEQIPPVKPAVVFDTSDLARYLQQPGSLKEAAKELLGVDMSKEVRAAMRNKVLSDLPEEKRAAVLEYALQDAVRTLEIWLKHEHKWPARERRLAYLTRDMGRKGIPIDADALAGAIEKLQTTLWETRAKIPWEDPVLSHKQVAVYCRSHGILPPLSLAKDSVDFESWVAKHGKDHPCVQAMGEYRRQNTLLERLKGLQARTMENGRVAYELKYCGATNTRRWSGAGGANFQNFPRDPMFGVDIRKLFTAPEGKLFAVVDLSNIEPRALAVLSQDWDGVKYLSNPKNDPYELTARRVFDYEDPRPLKEVDKKLRQLSKVVTLGASYGTGPGKFVDVAKKMADLVISAEESETVIREYRANNPKLTAFWRKLDTALRGSVGDDLTINLPGGNALFFEKVRRKGDDIVYLSVGAGGKKVDTKTFGARLTENVTQATAREVFAHYLMALDDKGFEVVLHVHDEVVVLVDAATAERDLATIVEIMSTPPPWMPKLPALAEGHLCKQYAKG